jgi:hypothetical protein
MSSYNISSLPPMILVPTEHSIVTNGEDPVHVKYPRESNENRSFSEIFDSNLQSLVRETKSLFTFHPREWVSAFRPNPKFPLFVLGDIDGFVALFMNNLATLLAVILGLRIVFENDIIYGKIIPG